MKPPKSLLIVSATSALAVLCIGANSGTDQRPAEIPGERWISMNDRAGFVITETKAADSVGAELYVKTAKGWRRARVENPVHAYPLSP